MKKLANLKGKKIVLIGGAGFIGHHLALELKRQEAEVSVIDGLQVNNLLPSSAKVIRMRRGISIWRC